MDDLEGLKENVIVGRLIPAETGVYATNYKRLATKRDKQNLIDSENPDTQEVA
jgi:DNA-directed RNA polymerase subunit beta'